MVLVGVLVASSVESVACGGDTDGGVCASPDITHRVGLERQESLSGPSDVSSLFGGAVAIAADGETIVVGAPDDAGGGLGVGSDPTDRSKPGAGAAYVFARAGSRWAQQAYLKPSTGYGAEHFGAVLSLSADGNTLVVGVPEDSNPDRGGASSRESGSAFVFVRINGTWRERSYLRASRAADRTHFGASVAVSADGSVIVVGAPEDSAGVGAPIACESYDVLRPSRVCEGAVFVFEGDAGRGWSETAILEVPTLSQVPHHIGHRTTIADDGRTVVTSGLRTIHAFVRSDRWSQEAELVPPDDARDASPLWALVASGDARTIVTGRFARESDHVSIFTRGAGAIVPEGELRARQRRPEANFGRALALSRDGVRLAVGAPYDDDDSMGVNPSRCGQGLAGAGTTYLFAREIPTSTSWLEIAYIKPASPQVQMFFGGAVGLDGNGSTLVVGAPRAPGGGGPAFPGTVDVFR